MKRILPMLAVLFLLIGCDEKPKSPSDAFLIPQEQISTVTKAADNGDLVAIKRLIAHYEATSGNDVIAEKWKAKARSLGDPQELYYYSASLFTAARRENDASKKHEMLVEALEAANRSYASHADKSTQQLIDEIKRIIN